MIPRRRIRLLFLLSGLAALLAALSALWGMVQPGFYHMVPEQLRPGAYSQDTVTLAAAVGIALSIRAIRNGLEIAWTVWAGLVGYLVYAYALYSFDRVVTPAFPLYLAVLGLSVFAAALFLRHVDVQALVVREGRAPPRRGVALLLGVLVVLFAGLWAGMLAPAIMAGEALDGMTIFVLDLAFALPLTALAAILAWRGSPAGDLLAIVMLMKVGTLGVSVFLGTAYAPLFFGAAASLSELALYGLMGFGPLVLLWPYLRALTVQQPPMPEAARGG